GDARRAETDGDDDEDGHNGGDVDIFKVHRRHLDEVFGHGPLPRHHGGGVVGLDDLVDLVDLAVLLVAGGLVDRVDHHQLFAPGVDLVAQLVGDDVVGDPPAHVLVVGDD